MNIIFQAPAKLNLTLDVLGRREDGYHTLDTLMQSVRLYDTVQIKEEKSTCVRFYGLRVGPVNTVTKAIDAYREASGVNQGVHVIVNKRIPTRAGMGGGSADAAAVLLGMQALYGALSREQLFEAALRVGADVPYCLNGGLCRAQGIGEQLTPLNSMHLSFLVVKPEKGVGTKQLFQNLQMPVVHPDTQTALEAIEQRDAALLGTCLGNALEEAAVGLLPEIARIKERMLQKGALGASMTGSGSAVFGLFANKKEAAAAAASFGDYPFVWACDSVF